MYCDQNLKISTKSIDYILSNDDFANQGIKSSHILLYVMLESGKSTTFRLNTMRWIYLIIDMTNCHILGFNLPFTELNYLI